MKTAALLNRMAIVGAMAVFIGSVSAQDRDIGKIEYQSNCASCHGIGAKGDGPLSTELKKRPTDLTVLAKKRFFPLNSVTE
jgi:mono/diheme cytochrome c family protein